MTAVPPITVLIVDDSELVRVGLRSLLGATGQCKVVGDAGTVASAIEAAAKLKPQVILLDIRLPDGTGFQACREILRKNSECRILILSSVSDDKLVDEAIRSGAHGYLLKEINGQGLIQAIADVAAGKAILDPAITAQVMRLIKSGQQAKSDVLAQLSNQERRVLSLIASGHTNKEVAAEMNLAEKTVKNYTATIFEKLQVSRRAQAAALYAQGNQDRRPGL